MRWLHAWFYRAAALWRRRTHEADMAEEIRAHLEALIERNIAAGMSREEARYAAQRTFGGVEQLKEKCRDERRFRWLEDTWTDLRQAARGLWKTPGFTFVAVLSLAIGLGANTAVFTLCNDVLLQALPVPHPSELVVLRYTEPAPGTLPPEVEITGERLVDRASGRTFVNAFSPVAFAGLRRPAADLAELFAFAPLPQLSALVDGQPELVPLSQVVSGNYASALGLQARLGRLITPADDVAGAAPVAMISFRYWQQRFDGNPATVGKVVWLNNVPVTIVGIAPAAFSGTLQVGESPDFFVPLALMPRLRPDARGRFDANQTATWWLRVMGRLGPEATPAGLEARLGQVFRATLQATYPNGEFTPPRLAVVPGSHGLDEARQSYRPSLLILTGIAALVLLIACVNVANLLLARATARRRELAVRLALGATRARLVRQWLIESLLLAGLGAGFGLLLARGAGVLLLALRPSGGSALVFPLQLDWRVFGFTLLVALATTLVFGLSPALRATKLDLQSEFQSASGSRRRGRLAPAKLLIVVQVALSLVLLVAAGLFTRTLRNLQGVDVGFNPSHLLLFQIDAVGAGRNREQVAGLYRRLNERLAAVPGVRASTYSLQPLLGGRKLATAHARPPGAEAIDEGPRETAADVNGVGPGFFATYQIATVAGRTFAPGEATMQPIVVNETLARNWFGLDRAIGRRLPLGEVIGVVRDSSYGDLKQPVAPTIYVPFPEVALPDLDSELKANFAVRTAGDPAAALMALRRAIRDVDPKLPLSHVRTQEAELDRQLQQERLFARLSAVFGLLAVALLCVGLYGLMSYAVLQRTTEIGVRMALGAMPGSVQRMILGESLGLVGLGFAIGLAGAALVLPHVQPLLYGLSPGDPLIYGGVGILLLGVGAAASWLPARRAARVDAMTALRCE